MTEGKNLPKWAKDKIETLVERLVSDLEADIATLTGEMEGEPFVCASRHDIRDSRYIPVLVSEHGKLYRTIGLGGNKPGERWQVTLTKDDGLEIRSPWIGTGDDMVVVPQAANTIVVRMAPR